MLGESDVAPFYDHGGIDQLVDHLAFNQRVVGSIPTSPTKRIKEGGGVAKRPDWKLIKQDYLDNHDTIQLKDLAKKHGVKPATLRSRKNREKWDDELPGVATRKATQRKDVATSKKKRDSPMLPEAYLTEEDIEGPGLTEMQRLFCLYFVKLKNKTQAAINAGYSPTSAYSIGHENMKKPEIRAEVNRLRKKLSNELFVDAMDILEMYAKIAFADITDMAEFGTQLVPVMASGKPIIITNEVTGKKEPLLQEVNVVRLKESFMVDGQLISEVKQGKDGVGVKLIDKMKALEKLELYFDVIPDKWKRQIEEEKVKIAKMRVPHTGLTNNVNITVELVGDDDNE